MVVSRGSNRDGLLFMQRFNTGFLGCLFGLHWLLVYIHIFVCMYLQLSINYRLYYNKKGCCSHVIRVLIMWPPALGGYGDGDIHMDDGDAVWWWSKGKAHAVAFTLATDPSILVGRIPAWDCRAHNTSRLDLQCINISLGRMKVA